jgi:tRNA (cytidine/uridine-2'-O-)-methyltransferase
MATGAEPGLGERFHVILVEPEIAGNVGAIGRTCVAAGAMLWLVRPLGFLVTDRHIKRAGLDYWPHLVWRVVDHLDEVAEALGPDRLWLFSTRGTTSYTDARFTLGDALVFGPERPGRSLRIPIQPEARSLNLSNSVAVALFEAVRQHGPDQARPDGSGRV